MVGKIVIIFGAIIILGIGLYIYNSGVIGKGFKFLNALAPLSVSSTPPVIGPAYPPAPPPSSASAPIPAINPADLPQGFTASQISPYFHEVRFGGISPGSFFSYGQISLYAYPARATATINVTGWQIKSNRGGQYIPRAVNLYDPSGVAPATDILLGAGDVLNLYSTSAPVNLRINKCMGYLQNKTQFNPQLPQNCPSINRSEIQTFSGACQNYILSLGGCQLPDFSDPFVTGGDYACRDYLNNHFNYRSCFNERRGDPDFLSREVRAWTGSSPVDPSHDRILLIDANGLLVDLYSY